MTFDHSDTFFPLEVKFLHLEDHSHYQRGASRASNLHKTHESTRVQESSCHARGHCNKKGEEKYRTHGE